MTSQGIYGYFSLGKNMKSLTSLNNLRLWWKKKKREEDKGVDDRKWWKSGDEVWVGFLRGLGPGK